MASEFAGKVESVLERHGRDKDNLIAILLDCQEEFTYLPREVVEHVANSVGAPKSQVLGLATFYRRFSLKPVGRHPIHVCMGTACHVQGGPRLLDALERELSIKRGETTPDLQFGLDTVNCLGCCGLAPVITVGKDVHGKLRQVDIPRVVKKYKR
jgi:NADH-quinone oxidoreductase subunit E